MADVQYKLNFPIETPEAYEFWESRHRLNRIKAIMAFSLDKDNANDNLRRAGYYRQYRKRYLELYDCIIAHPDMKGIPLSDLTEYWYDPIAICPLVPPSTVNITFAAADITASYTGNSGSATGTFTTTKNVTLSPTSKVNLSNGDKVTITVTPKRAIDTINGGAAGASATIEITVSGLVVSVPVTDVALDGTTASQDILVGYHLPIKVKVTPTNSTNQKVDWVSSAPPSVSVANDPADTNQSDAIAIGVAPSTGVTITGSSSDKPAEKVTVTLDVIDPADTGLYMFVQNNIGTQTGWLPAQDATDKNKWTINTTLSTAVRYMGVFIRKTGSNTNITGAADGITAVSSDPTTVLVDNVGGHGFQMHPKKAGTATITISTTAGDGHPNPVIVGTLVVTTTTTP